MTIITEIQTKKHAKLSPSASKRFITCAGSVQLIKQVNPDNVRTSSRFAAEGSVAHEICDLCLTTLMPSEYYLNQKFSADGFTFTVTQEMLDAVDVYVKYVNEQAHEHDAVIESEVWGSLEFLGVPGLTGGTTDARLMSHKNNQIIIIDYKHGQGVAVDVIENTQLMCYGLSSLKVLDDLGIDLKDWTVKMVIVQPRAHHSAGVIREWEIPAQELGKWGEDVLKPAGELTASDNPPFKVSDEGCRFCEAAGICKTLMSKTQEMAIVDFEDIEIPKDKMFPHLPTLTTEAKTNIMLHGGAIRAFIIAVENQIKLEMESGSKEYNDHFKLVQKVTRRKFDEGMDDQDFSPILDFLPEDTVFTKKINGIGDIERALKKEFGAEAGIETMKAFVIKPEGDIVVAKLSDKRKEVAISAKTDFIDLKDGEIQENFIDDVNDLAI